MSGFMILRANAYTSADVYEELSALDKSAVGNEGWSVESFRTEAEKSNGYVLYVIDDEGRAAALLTGYSAVGEGDITSVAVAPQYRRRGYAYALIEEFERLLPDDTENIFLEVRMSNLPAQALYKKLGFEQISVRRDFYEDPPEDAIVMIKRI